ncbi:hypothetical protein ACPTC9_004487, partial [Shigella flexneri]|nr:hypothetical protein [Shigella flexneri]
MAKPDWEAIESAYRAGVLSLRDIGEKYGVTEGAIRKRAKKLDWARSGGTQVCKNGTQKRKVRTSRKPAITGLTQKSTQLKTESTPDTKPIRGMRTDPPTNPFQPGNQQALKH